MADAVGIAGLIVGGVGSAAGIGALVYAHIANANAKKSGKAADDSKQLAEQANDLARESNTIATDARQLAEEANEFSRRGEARETERHDVHWGGDWDRPGVYALTKLGDDEAHAVTATVVYDGERVTQRADIITDNGHQLIFEFPTAVRDFRDEVRDHRRRREADTTGLGLGSTWGMNVHRVDHRVEWTTPNGNPRLHEDGGLTMFDHFYPDN